MTRLLIAVDGTPPSDRAFRLALRMARKSDTLVIVYVRETESLEDVGGVALREDVAKSVKTHAQQVLLHYGSLCREADIAFEALSPTARTAQTGLIQTAQERVGDLPLVWSVCAA